jgi:hypothetical protein
MRSALIPLLLLFAMDAFAGPPEQSTADVQALELARALRLESIFEAIVRNTFLNDYSYQQLPEAARACLASLDLSNVNELYANVIRQVLTPAEIAAELRYYQSRAGYMNTMMTARMYRKQIGGSRLLEEADAAGEPNDVEARQMKEFARSPLAKRIDDVHAEAGRQRVTDIALHKMTSQCLKRP